MSRTRSHGAVLCSGCTSSAVSSLSVRSRRTKRPAKCGGRSRWRREHDCATREVSRRQISGSGGRWRVRGQTVIASAVTSSSVAGAGGGHTGAAVGAGAEPAGRARGAAVPPSGCGAAAGAGAADALCPGDTRADEAVGGLWAAPAVAEAGSGTMDSDAAQGSAAAAASSRWIARPMLAAQSHCARQWETR